MLHILHVFICCNIGVKYWESTIPTHAYVILLLQMLVVYFKGECYIEKKKQTKKKEEEKSEMLDRLCHKKFDITEHYSMICFDISYT